MKMTNDDFYLLERTIHNALDKFNINLDDYAESFETETGLMWGLYHLANEQNWHNLDGTINPIKRDFIFREFYNKYNDSHIQTALKRVLKNIRDGVLISNDYNGLVIHKALQNRCYKDVTIILDDKMYHGELVGLSDNIYQVYKLGLMFIGDDVWKIQGNKIWLC